MHLTYQYRLKPSKAMKERFEEILHEDRMLYNAALQERIDCYRKTGETITLYDQQKSLTRIRADDPEIAKGHVARQRGPLRRLDRSFKSFWRRCKKGEKPGFPRFKGRDRWDSIEIADQVHVRDGRLHAKDFEGGVKIRLHRPVPKHARLKGAVVRKDAKGWLVNLKLDMGEAPAKREVETSVGIDLGLDAFIATSDGALVKAPRHFRQSEKELRRAQRKLARAKKGSKSRQKKKEAVQKTHLKVRNQRKDFHHKLSRELVDRNDLIALEKLQVQNMAGNRSLAKSVHDAGWRHFTNMVACKAEEAGKHVVFVDPRNTSQECSGCGEVVKKSLSVRVHNCHSCGLSMDRDVNAARNILDRAGHVLASPSGSLESLDAEMRTAA